MLFVSAAIVFLLGAMWLPVYLSMRKRNVRPIAKQCAIVFIVQALSATGLIWLADAIGLLNPGGYILAIVIGVAVAGVMYARFAPLPVTQG